MGRSGSGWSPYHDEKDVRATRNAFSWAERYNRNVSNDLNAIYRELDYEQQRVQSNALREELVNLMKKKDVEWRIYEEEIKKSQANYISNLYTNRVAAELGNLKEIVNEK